MCIIVSPLNPIIASLIDKFWLNAVGRLYSSLFITRRLQQTTEDGGWEFNWKTSLNCGSSILHFLPREILCYQDVNWAAWKTIKLPYIYNIFIYIYICFTVYIYMFLHICFKIVYVYAFINIIYCFIFIYLDLFIYNPIYIYLHVYINIIYILYMYLFIFIYNPIYIFTCVYIFVNIIYNIYNIFLVWESEGLQSVLSSWLKDD